jgi:ribosome-binding factor A
MAQFKRSERVSEVIHRAISPIIRDELWDERVKQVTVTGVETSRDLKHAYVYVSILGDETERANALKALAGAAGFLRSRLGEELSLRYTPEIHIRYDSSIVDGMHMDKLLSDLNSKS